jgi:hypothetical protein
MTIPASANPLLLKAPAGGGGYAIERSLRFNSSDSAYLSRTPSTAGNRKTWTWAGWVKRSDLSTSDFTLFSGGTTLAHTATTIIFFRNNKLCYSSITQDILQTEAVYRDASAWYHIVVALDTTQATASNRLKFYVNGSQVTQFSTDARSAQLAQNTDYGINNTEAHGIGRFAYNGSKYFSGLLADVHFCDGTAYDASAFGEFDDNGIWQPIAYSGSYGTNGFHLPFSDNSTAAALGTDTSGNGNTWTVNNISNVSGGPTSVAAASGALPIYNTTDTYGTIKGTGTRTDSLASSIQLCIPCGTQTGLDLVDQNVTGRSASVLTVTNNGVLHTTATSKYYSGSADFSGSYSKWAQVSNADGRFNLASRSQTTIEFWYRCDSSSGAKGVLATGSYTSTGWEVFIDTNGGFSFVAWNGTNFTAAVGTGAATLGQWHHGVVSINSLSVTLYLDGVSSGSTTASSFPNGSSTLNIGRRNTWPASDTGVLYLQGIRVYSTIKYTSNFNPPSSTQNTTIAAGNDSLVDVPTNGTETDTGVGGEVRGNYATLNPLTGGTSALSNGNLQVTSTTAYQHRYGTIGISSGKFYWEHVFTALTTAGVVGISNDISETGSTYNGIRAYLSANGNKYSGTSASSYGPTWTVNDVMGIALDMDSGSLTFYKNGVSQGVAFTGLTGTWFPLHRDDGSSTAFLNFGQRPFAYTAPSGFKALNTANLPEGAITTSGTFTGNANADGPFVYLNGIPTAMTINGNAVTFATHADKLSSGFKLRTSSTSYNTSGSNTYFITTTGDKFKFARAQPNP